MTSGRSNPSMATISVMLEDSSHIKPNLTPLRAGGVNRKLNLKIIILGYSLTNSSPKLLFCNEKLSYFSCCSRCLCCSRFRSRATPGVYRLFVINSAKNYLMFTRIPIIFVINTGKYITKCFRRSPSLT